MDGAAVLQNVDLAARLVFDRLATKRMEFMFLISQRVPSFSPGLRTETFTSARMEPSSILPSQVPR